MIARTASGKSVSRFLYGAALIIIFALAAWQRFSIPLEPIADPDTWGYLSPALGKLSGAEFGHAHGRNFVYPGFLFLLLRAFGDFRAITIAQHLLGLSAGAIFLLTWRRLRIFVPDSRIAPAHHEVLGLAGAAIYILTIEPILFEKQIRPEGVCGFVLSINLFAIIQFVACGFIERRRTSAVAYGIAVAFTSVLLASIKPSFWFVAIVDLVPVAFFFFQRGWLRQQIALGIGVVTSAGLLLWPEHLLGRNDEASRTFLPTTLFVMHANLIRDQMAEDLERAAKVPYPREWLERVYATLNAEIAKASAPSTHFPSLGFDPNYLMYHETSIGAQLRREFGRDLKGRCGFYRFYYWRIWQQRPLAMIEKIARQMSIFYAPKCPVYNWRKDRALADGYSRSVTSLGHESYRKIALIYAPASDSLIRTEALARNAPVAQQRRLIRMAVSLLAINYLPSLMVALVLIARVLSHAERRKRLAWLAAFVLFAYLYNAVSCLEVAIVNSLDVRRYLTVQMYATVLAQFLALWFILEFALENRERPT
jgi:hypothetical protein